MTDNSYQRLLFICSGNYYRSRYAEILFNHLAQLHALPWRADSRGFRLSPGNVGPISQYTAAACQRQGLPLDAARMPQVLTEADLEMADRIIALKEAEHRPMMRERFPQWEDRVEFWAIHDIDCAPPETALLELAERVRALVLGHK
jgi:protein-tyrosine phosphatase